MEKSDRDVTHFIGLLKKCFEVAEVQFLCRHVVTNWSQRLHSREKGRPLYGHEVQAGSGSSTKCKTPPH